MVYSVNHIVLLLVSYVHLLWTYAEDFSQH
jgi:hypothetical protein